MSQAARIRASLFNFNPPVEFATGLFLERLFEQRPDSLPIPVAPTREFCVGLFTSKIEATIKDIGDVIGYPSDNETVGPIAAAAKQSLLRLIPHIMPADSDETSLYRLVLEHGDFGIHNMSITTDSNGEPLVTSLYDWETGCIAPAILSDPLMALYVDLVTDENAEPSITRIEDTATADDRLESMTWAEHYIKASSSLVHVSSSGMHEQENNCLSRCRFCLKKRPITNVRFRQEKMHATCGLRCTISEEMIRKDISVSWELGLSRG